MKKKVILSLLTGLLVSTLAFSVAGCGDETANGEQSGEQNSGSQNEQPHEHDWGEWTITKKATCTEKGEEQRVCKTDPTHKETRAIEIDFDAHAWDEWQVAKEPTCFQEGEEERICKKNSSHKETRAIEIDPDSHDWDEGKVTKEPNCKEEGVFTYTCKYNEEHKKTEKISSDPAAHTLGKDNKCTVCGKSATTGLNFESIDDGKSFCVSGIGDATEENIIIPSSYLEKPVTKIGSRAFSDCKSIQSITIPSSVTEIGYYAFESCTSLESITIPDGVTEISRSAFWNCTSLRSVTISDGVTVIGEYAFSGCCRLVEVVNLSYVSYSWSYVLDVYDTTDFESKIKRQDGFVFYEGDEVTYLIDYEGDKTEITLPEKFNGKTYEIRRCAFYGKNALKNVIIPDGVTTIDEYAFESCTSLESIIIPDSVTEIGGGAFSGCTSLESITIPDSVTKIGGGAFKSCTSLKTVIIGSGVKEISKDTFSGCESLESVTFENTEEWTINGKAVDVTDSKKNAELLKANMGTWYRS